MIHPPRQLIWIQLALVIAVLVVPIKKTNPPSSPVKSIRQSITQEMLHDFTPNLKFERQIELNYKLLSSGICNVALAILLIATLHLYFWDDSPYLIFDLKRCFSKLKKKQPSEATAVTEELNELIDCDHSGSAEFSISTKKSPSNEVTDY